MLLFEFVERRLGPQDAALDIDREQFVAGGGDAGFRQVGKPQEAVEHSGIADENVEPAKRGDGFRDRPLVVVEPAHIAADCGHLIAEPRPQLLAAAGDAVHDRDPRALLDIAFDDGPADARAAARDQRYLPVEPAHDALSLTMPREPQRVRLYS